MLVPYPFPVEVAIHTILYVRQIYPPDLFVRRKKYDIPVFQSRHPALNEYISGAVKAIADELVSVRRPSSLINSSGLPHTGKHPEGDSRDKRQGPSCP